MLIVSQFCVNDLKTTILSAIRALRKEIMDRLQFWFLLPPLLPLIVDFVTPRPMSEKDCREMSRKTNRKHKKMLSYGYVFRWLD